MLSIRVLERASGREILLDFDGGQTVGQLKERLRDLVGADPSRMRLTDGGSRLNNGTLLLSTVKTTNSALPVAADEEIAPKQLLDFELTYILDGGCPEH